MCWALSRLFELRALTPDVHGFLGKSCLSGEDAAGSALTRVAVAHGNANGLAGDFGLELATAAGCGAGSHDRFPMRLFVAPDRALKELALAFATLHPRR